MRRRARVALGWLAVACCVVHGGYHVLRGRPHNLLWPCNLGSLLVGLGVLLRRPAVNAVGLLWLAVGTPLWMAGPLIGNSWLPTAPLTHFGGLAVGLAGAVGIGLPRGVWRTALAGAMAALVGRWLLMGTDASLAAVTVPGAERFFASSAAFALAVAGFYAAAFVGIERALRWARRHAPAVRRGTAAGRAD